MTDTAHDSKPSQEEDSSTDLSTVTKAAEGLRGFAKISDFISSFNANCADDQKLDGSDIESKLKAAGAVNDTILRTLSAKDIAETTGMSEIIAKALQKELAQLTTSGSTRPKLKPSRFQVERMELEDLFRQYNPKEIGSVVNRTLKRIIQDELGRNPKIIVFNSDEETVNGGKSFELLQEALQGEPDIDRVKVDGGFRYTYRLGELPNQVVRTHPIYENQAIRNSGMGSDGLDWSRVSIPAQQMLRLAVETGEIDPQDLSRPQLIDIYERASGENGFEKLQNYYEAATRRYLSLEPKKALPQLLEDRSSIDPSASIFDNSRDEEDDW